MQFFYFKESPEELENQMLDEQLDDFLASQEGEPNLDKGIDDLILEKNPEILEETESDITAKLESQYEADVIPDYQPKEPTEAYEPMTEEDFRIAHEASKNTIE